MQVLCWQVKFGRCNVLMNVGWLHVAWLDRLQLVLVAGLVVIEVSPKLIAEIACLPSC